MTRVVTTGGSGAQLSSAIRMMHIAISKTFSAGSAQQLVGGRESRPVTPPLTRSYLRETG